MKRQLNDLEQRVVDHATSLGLTVTVPPTLRPGSRLLFVGEAPGEDEEDEGEGFVGKAGTLLWKMCGAAGISREDVSYSNVVKFLPQLPFNEAFVENVTVLSPTKKNPVKAVSARKIATWVKEHGGSSADAIVAIAAAWFEAHPPKVKCVRKTTGELEKWLSTLAYEIEELRPQTVVAIGEHALQALSDEKGISNWQGSRLPLTPGTTVIPIIHPAAVLHGQQWQDVYLTTRILRRAQTNNWPTYPEPELKTDPTLEEVLAFLWKAWTAERWCVDVETRGAHVVCFSVAAKWGDVWRAICIPTSRQDRQERWPWADNDRVWSALRALYEHNPRVVNHYLCAFDSEWLDFYGVKITDHYMDTLIAFHLLYPELKKGLDDCIRFYGLGNYHKGMVKHTAKSLSNNVLWPYNNLDAIRTLQLSYELDADLAAKGLTERYHTDRKAVACLGLGVQRAGFGIGEATECEIRTILAKAERQAQTALNEITGEILNVASPKQVQHYLYETLKLNPKQKNDTKTHTKRVTSDDEALTALSIQYPKERGIKLISNIRHFRKIAGSYLGMERVDGHSWSAVNIAGTESFRWSMGVSARGFGVNAQTFPEVTRLMIVPEPGKVLVSIDLSQVEARYVAHLARCQSQIAMFNDPTRSFHLENARRIFGREVSKNEPAYVDAKRVGHGGNYKLGPGRLSLMLGKPFGYARKLLEEYHKQYPEIRRWHSEVRETLRRQGYLINPFGVRRDFFDALGCRLALGTVSEHQWKEAIAWVPQSIPPEVVNRVMLKLKAMFVEYIDFHIHGHDSFLASVPINWQKEFIEAALAFFANTYPTINGQPVIVPAEAKVGYAWHHMLEWKGEPVTREQWDDHLAHAKENYERQVLAGVLQVSENELDAELGY